MKIQASLKVLVKSDDSWDYVNDAIKMIKDSKMKYHVSPSETTVEGEYSDILSLFNDIHNYLVNENLEQVIMFITTEYNSKNLYVDEKLENVKKVLN